MPQPTGVEFEFERDGNEVILSVRNGQANFVLTLPLDGASVFAASATRAADESTSTRFRFQIQRARLEVSR
jgi:hypothetical protein